MAMLQSERLRLLEESTKRVISRNKCVDSSLQTLIAQSRASSSSAPTIVSAVMNQNGCAANVVISGKGTNGEYLGILQEAQNCAVCKGAADNASGVYPIQTVAVPAVNFAVQPFAQQNISTIYPAPYVAPCTDPGNRVYFPTPQNKGDSCNYRHLPYDS